MSSDINAVRLVCYNHRGDAISETVFSAITLEEAVYAAVVSGFASGGDFHIVEPAGVRPARLYWVGRQRPYATHRHPWHPSWDEIMDEDGNIKPDGLRKHVVGRLAALREEGKIL